MTVGTVGPLLGVLVLAIVVISLALVAPAGQASGAIPGFGGPTVENVEGERTVTVTYAIPGQRAESFTLHDRPPELADGEANWAWIPSASLPAALESAAGDHESGVMTVGEWALVGDLQAASARVGARPVTVVAPAGMAVDPARKVGFLAAFAGPYELAPESAEPVTILLGAEALPDEGRMYGTTGYVTGTPFWDGSVSSVWIHEYVHAVQTFETAPEMDWLREASATYFAMRFMAEQYDGVSEADLRHRIDAIEREGVSLANASSWADSGHYDRGGRLLYALDEWIRAETAGEATLVDVVRAMNRAEEPITIERFESIVAETTGTEPAWLRPAIETSEYDLADRIDRFESNHSA